MATLPVLLNPSPSKSSRSLNTAWMGALLAVVFVACTSNNYMGGTHSQRLLTAVWEEVLGKWHWESIGWANIWLRKIGHFIGHGMLSLVFCRAWYSTIRKNASLRRVWRRPTAGMLAVATTFVIACLDELHQHFVPGRVGSFRDVVIDASGALVANLILLAVINWPRPRLVEVPRTARQTEFRMAA